MTNIVDWVHVVCFILKLVMLGHYLQQTTSVFTDALRASIGGKATNIHSSFFPKNTYKPKNLVLFWPPTLTIFHSSEKIEFQK